MNSMNGVFMFGIEPNEEGKINGFARHEDTVINFTVTESDLHRMLSSIHSWKAKKHSKMAAYGTDCRNGSCDV